MRATAKKKVVGIVCEYNPFHQGHAFMIQKLRENKADAVVCVMSGPFVQRAEAALFCTSLRARAAVLAGVDLVYRLPLAWATSSAEGFARGAVGLLAALGSVQEVAFGAETPNVDTLMELASLLKSPGFQEALQKELHQGESFATIRAKVAQTFLPDAKELLSKPNNILGVEYCKALLHEYPAPGITEGQSHLRPFALARKGAQHDGNPCGGIASASWLRSQAQAQGVKVFENFVPPECQPLYASAWEKGCVLEYKRFEMLLLSRLRGLTASQIGHSPGAGEGLENRLAKAAVECASLQELYAQAKSKRFAHSRVRRLALSAALGITSTPADTAPFLHLLAASPAGLELLGETKPGLPMGTSLAKLAKTSPQAAEVAQKEALAEDLHALCLASPTAGGGAFTTPFQLVANSRAE